jgi:hypothetical protein
MDYMHARFFSQNLARFLSVDTLPGRPGAPQSWNRYGYVEGGPLLYYDPDGLGKAKAVIKLVELTFGNRKVMGRFGSRQAAIDAQQEGADLLLPTRSSAREIAQELGDGKPPIHEVGKGKGQYPHYHPAGRKGGHIFYAAAAGLTLSHYAQGHGTLLESLAFVGDLFNPLSLPQDAIDLYEFFIQNGESGTVFGGVEVTAFLPSNPYVTVSAQPFLQGLSAYGHHTGNFISTYDLFIGGQVCIDGVCAFQPY